MTKEEKAEYMRQWRAANPERSLAINRKSWHAKGKKWRETNRDRINVRRRELYPAWYEENREACLERCKQDYATSGFEKHIRRTYGLTMEGFNAILEKQNGRCAICGTDNPASNGRTSDRQNWHVDHDHNTKRVRGLLCFRCNVAIGHLQDDPILVKAALDYLINSMT
jgi:hypothetical protein